MLPGTYIMTNKWGREGEGRRQRQGEEEGREREIDWEGEKEIKRERGKGGGMEGRKEGEREMKIALSNFIFVQCILNSFKCVSCHYFCPTMTNLDKLFTRAWPTGYQKLI